MCFLESIRKTKNKKKSAGIRENSGSESACTCYVTLSKLRHFMGKWFSILSGIMLHLLSKPVFFYRPILWMIGCKFDDSASHIKLTSLIHWVDFWESNLTRSSKRRLLEGRKDEKGGRGFALHITYSGRCRLTMVKSTGTRDEMPLTFPRNLHS